MKKSNILLIVGFLGIVVLISAIHISLYAKYKAGNYTVYNENELLAADVFQTFPNIAFVSIRNIPIANVRFADVAQTEKVESEDIQFSRNGDTLTVSAKEGFDRGRISLRSLTLPKNITVSLFNSTLVCEPGKKQGDINPVFYLNKSAVYFSGGTNGFQLRNVKLVASDKSSAVFEGNTIVDSLDVQLSQSSIEYKDGDFGQMSIVTDSLSRISLQTKHLLKANIKTLAPQ